MSKFQEFKNQFNGYSLEVVDSSAYSQCFDLIVGWCDWLDIPRVFPFNYAYQIFTSFGDTQAKYFDKIYNGADNSPKEGDIIVWSYYYNWYAGHTAVATGEGKSEGKSTDWFNAFSQNDPTGAVCGVKKYNYNNVLGWLRPKVTTPNADSYISAAKDAIISARNSVNTGSQVGDPDFKTKCAIIKTKAQEIISLIDQAR